MITVGFLALLGFSALFAFADWRRAWLLAVLCGVLQDPARKLTAGTPVVMSLSIVAVYAAVLIANQARLRLALRDFANRFGNVFSVFVLFSLFLLLATVNGLFTFGLDNWEAPLLSLFIYVAPLPAVIVGYVFVDREERLLRFLRFYAIVTSVALIGGVLEYLRFDSRALGLVAQQGEYIRHLPGMHVRMISGFYRGPDIMGWHAATLTCIAAAMAVRAGFTHKSWPWIGATAWGFFNVMISGRRKAVYYVAVFAIVFLWRYARRLNMTQVIALLAIAGALGYVIREMSATEQTSVYARGAIATQRELLGRLEGGVMSTVAQTGVLGAGLGTATQGVYHLVGKDLPLGWQEGGLGKFAIELGIPGVIVAALLAFALLRILMRISSAPDEPASSKFTRVALFALVVANITNFMASAQAYSDSMLTLLTAFITGCLFATATLEERTALQPAPTPRLSPVTA